jgi:hypothetical protein
MSRKSNAADEAAIKERELNARFSRKQELADLRELLSLPAGRRLFWRYLTYTGVYQLSFTGSSETFFREGRRDVGLKMLADITEADPDGFILLMQENRKGVENE